MEANITDIVDAICHVDGTISIKRLSDEEIASLSEKVVWTYKDQKGPKSIYRFGDTTFRPHRVNKGVTINTGSVRCDFEIKSMMILLLHTGVKEGGTPYKWQSVSQRVRTLSRFARYCVRRGYASFSDLESVPLLKLRTMLLGFITDDKKSGGMNGKVSTSAYKSVRDALKHIGDYELVSRGEFMPFMDEFTLRGIDQHESENRLRHTIIPTGVMKKVITEATAYVENAEAKFDEFATLFRKANNGIAVAKCVNAISAIQSTERKAAKLLKILLYSHFRDLQRHTYALTLAFTGMRDDEAGALSTGCSGHKVDSGDDMYFVRSLLSKTDDSQISLDWVANELVHRAVALLSKVNGLYYERAKLFQTYFEERLTSHETSEIEHGLSSNLLFGLRMTVASINFVRYTKGNDGTSALDLDAYRIPVTAENIAQLEQMECNYQSVAANSGKRGKPYVVGDEFNLTAHQFRHTFAWFIIANRLGDLDDIKYQFKHLRQAMTLIYAERGFKSLNELRGVIEYFEAFVNGKSIDDIVQSAVVGNVAGGGGERLVRLLQSLNNDVDETVYGTDQQPHFKNAQEVVAFTTRHSDSIRGLPHGYCTKGPSCKIKNAADPSHCLYCDTYFATPKHLPYWKAIRINCEAKITRIEAMPEESRQQFQVFKQSLDDNLFAANKIISRLEPMTVPTKQEAS